MTNIYKGKLYLSFEDIKMLHRLPEDSIIIPQIVDGAVEFCIASTEHKAFMAEGASEFHHLTRSKLLNIFGTKVKKEEANNVNITFNITGNIPNSSEDIESFTKKIPDALKRQKGLQ